MWGLNDVQGGRNPLVRHGDVLGRPREHALGASLDVDAWQGQRGALKTPEAGVSVHAMHASRKVRPRR